MDGMQNTQRWRFSVTTATTERRRENSEKIGCNSRTSTQFWQIAAPFYNRVSGGLGSEAAGRPQHWKDDDADKTLSEWCAI
jgi:hypothetical protein